MSVLSGVWYRAIIEEGWFWQVSTEMLAKAHMAQCLYNNLAEISLHGCAFVSWKALAGIPNAKICVSLLSNQSIFFIWTTCQINYKTNTVTHSFESFLKYLLHKWFILQIKIQVSLNTVQTISQQNVWHETCARNHKAWCMWRIARIIHFGLNGSVNLPPLPVEAVASSPSEEL